MVRGLQRGDQEDPVGFSGGGGIGVVMVVQRVVREHPEWWSGGYRGVVRGNHRGV